MYIESYSWIYDEKGKMQYLDNFIKKFPKFEKAWIVKAETYHDQAKDTSDASTKKAIKCLEKALKINPESIGALELIGIIYLSIYSDTPKEKPIATSYKKKALNYYDRIIELEPDNISAWQNKAMIFGETSYENKNDLQKEIEVTNKLIELEPDNPVHWYDKIYLLERQKEFEEALYVSEEAIEKFPQPTRNWEKTEKIELEKREVYGSYYFYNIKDIWKNKVICLKEIGEIQKALDFIEEALSVNNEWIQMWELKIKTLMERGYYEEALEACGEAEDIIPGPSLLSSLRKEIEEELY